MSIESKLQSIELAKLEESQKFDDIKIILANHNTRNRMLLEERQQAIRLAKEICPTYEKDNEFWAEVHDLSTQIKKTKDDIESYTNMLNDEMNKKRKSSGLATSLLNSITGIRSPDNNTPDAVDSTVEKPPTSPLSRANSVLVDIESETVANVTTEVGNVVGEGDGANINLTETDNDNNDDEAIEVPDSNNGSRVSV